MQMIFQDPMACLNPRQKVADIIAQGLEIHHLYENDAARKKVGEILQKGWLVSGACGKISASAFRWTKTTCGNCESADHESEADYSG